MSKWGLGGEENINWVKWEELCVDLRFGGLGLKNLEWFNHALMSKWIWRFLTESDLLWVRVVRASQGDIRWDGGGFRLAGRREMNPGWWKNVLGMSWGEGGKWFRESMEVQLGEGDTILFWHHRWAGEKTLKDLFPRLYRLSNNQDGSIKSMGEWVEGEWVWNLRWNRPLLEREQAQIHKLTSSINNFRVTAGKTDGWRWKASPSGSFSVKSAYKVLSAQAGPIVYRCDERNWAMIWKAHAPLKAITTVWKAFKGRLATCDNLMKRQVAIQNSEALCVLCKSEAETIEHLFSSCQKTDEIWKDILLWIGKQSAIHHKVEDQFLAFINLGSKEDKYFLLGVWICTVWCIWKGRNECKFNQGIWSKEKMIAEIKTRLWSWKLAFNMPISSTDFRRWFSAAKLLG